MRKPAPLLPFNGFQDSFHHEIIAMNNGTLKASDGVPCKVNLRRAYKEAVWKDWK